VLHSIPAIQTYLFVAVGDGVDVDYNHCDGRQAMQILMMVVIEMMMAYTI
jgi:hypothetical protein